LEIDAPTVKENSLIMIMTRILVKWFGLAKDVVKSGFCIKEIKMKDEEMAEEFANEKCKDCYMCSYSEHKNPYKICQRRKDVKQAFLAGLKAGRPQWHDLRKDKNDLPPKMLGNSNFSIEVLSDKGELVNYNFHYCEWFYWRSGSPIAWCEIPTFDKE
jgi:hypothetical protein